MNSILRTVTFKNAGAGQAANLVHCSEVALWGNLAKATLGTLAAGGAVHALDDHRPGIDRARCR